MPRAVAPLLLPLLLITAFPGQSRGQAKSAPTWTRVAEHAGWAPRDSQGEAAFKGKMWVIGGWFQSFEDPPRDVWASEDGKEWTRVLEAIPIKHTDLPTTLVFRDKMWMMGGWHGGRLAHASGSNEVWSTADGKEWTRETKAAGWSPRLAAPGVVFRDKMWILGGSQQYYFGNDGDLRSDIWSSEDGKEWAQVTAKAPWAPRAYHAAVAFRDKLWVFGGGNYLPNYEIRNDVWSSPDGVNWTRETEHAPWHGRLWFSAAVYRDRIWVLGGWTNNPSKNWNDVWYSEDGKSWKELKAEAAWAPRHEHSTFVFQDKLWVAGGMNPPLNNDVWRLDLPEGWDPDGE